jgi:hypothetical protein
VSVERRDRRRFLIRTEKRRVTSNKPLKRMVGRRRPPTAERQGVRRTLRWTML